MMPKNPRLLPRYRCIASSSAAFRPDHAIAQFGATLRPQPMTAGLTERVGESSITCHVPSPTRRLTESPEARWDVGEQP